MVASHHHLSVEDDVETEDDRPDDGEHQPHCPSLKEQSPIYLRFRCFESSFQNAKFRCFIMSRLVPTCGKNKATKPARQKTTRMQSNAPETQSMQ